MKKWKLIIKEYCIGLFRYGEDLQHAIYRRLKEEMGFTCELKEIFSFVYQVELEDNLFEHEYDHVFIGIYDGEIAVNHDEVADFKWVNVNQVKADMANWIIRCSEEWNTGKANALIDT